MQDQSYSNYDFPDEKSLKSFLSDCVAGTQGNAQFNIASISIPLTYVAPLAILQSININHQMHYYMDRPVDELSLFAFGSLVSDSFQGQGRFNSVKEFSSECLGRTKCYPNKLEAFTGPHFFNTFTFSDESMSEDIFPAATVFLPEWHLYSVKGRYGFVINLRVDGNSSVNDLFKSILERYNYFLSFDYSSSKNQRAHNKGTEMLDTVLTKSSFEKAVLGALEDIGKSLYHKIVLAQKITFKNHTKSESAQFLNQLRDRFPGCYTFSFSDGSGKSFIGSSPEKLLQIRKGVISTEAIAGSSSRGREPIQDAQLGMELLVSEKNLREHFLVKESILKRLKVMGIKTSCDERPRLLALTNVQHLMTKIKGVISSDIHILEIAAGLHPTPAVGGQPREFAVPRIRELEGFERGLYAGLLGWFNSNNDGDLIVGLRSAQFNKDSVDVFAGAGIVNGSKIEEETAEIELKRQAIMKSLMH